MKAVRQYFTKVMEVLGPLQSSNGGPIIAFQIENEYSAYGSEDDPNSRYYMLSLYQVNWVGVVWWEVDGGKGCTNIKGAGGRDVFHMSPSLSLVVYGAWSDRTFIHVGWKG